MRAHPCNIYIAADGGNRSEAAKARQDRCVAHITRVQNMIDARELADSFRTQ